MYNKDEFKQIRSVPTSKKEIFKTYEEIDYFLKIGLPEEMNGDFLYNKCIKGELPILALIQWDGNVVGSGIIKSIEKGYAGYQYVLKFDVSTIRNFETHISTQELQDIKLKRADGQYFKNFNMTPMKIDMDCFYDLNELFLSHYYPYEKSDLLEEAFLEKGENYDSMKYLLEKYKNLILQGPPGVGKTFLAKRLADSILGYSHSHRIEMVQFHQSYSYEDFIMGYKPNEDDTGRDFKLVDGPFYTFCKKAEKDPTKKHFFIIDEINRGDLSKIFGELFMLIEDDKRGYNNEIKLLYRDEEFSVPENVYIIGLMNTADRSIAMVDYALRRRFAFFDLKPGFDSDNFIEYQKQFNNESFDKVIEEIKYLNEKVISKDDSLGEGFCIGHSYFSNLEKSEDIRKDLRLIIRYKILPLLKEYWFDNLKNENITKLEKLSDSLKND